MELSSGEKQALILAAELYRRWRPGSLILIDEPELHFHSSWQTALWLMLQKWQKERGGQVIVATQSSHLFGLAEPGTTVLLGTGLV
jgi:predicted ATP-dependent endonuclease of OLD family